MKLILSKFCYLRKTDLFYPRFEMLFFLYLWSFQPSNCSFFGSSGDEVFLDACFLFGRQKIGLGVQLSNRCYSIDKKSFLDIPC